MTPERRQTPTERNHELLKLALERPMPASTSPNFKVEQVKAVGGATVYEWAVHIPVCDEYPDSEQAFDAACSFALRFAAKFPATATNGEHRPDADPKEKTARAAAAIARARTK